MDVDAKGASAATAEKSQPGCTSLPQSDVVGHLSGASMPSQGPEGSYVERQDANDLGGMTESPNTWPKQSGPARSDRPRSLQVCFHWSASGKVLHSCIDEDEGHRVKAAIISWNAGKRSFSAALSPDS